MAGIAEVPVFYPEQTDKGIERAVAPSLPHPISHPPFPKSFESWAANRVISLLKVGVSVVTFGMLVVPAAIAAVAWIIDKCLFQALPRIEVLRNAAFRCLLSLGTMFQGLRQLIYCSDGEDKEKETASFWDRGRAVLQIGNIPATSKNCLDMRKIMLQGTRIWTVYKRIFSPEVIDPEYKGPQSTQSSPRSSSSSISHSPSPSPAVATVGNSSRSPSPSLLHSSAAPPKSPNTAGKQKNPSQKGNRHLKPGSKGSRKSYTAPSSPNALGAPAHRRPYAPRQFT